MICVLCIKKNLRYSCEIAKYFEKKIVLRTEISCFARNDFSILFKAIFVSNMS